MMELKRQRSSNQNQFSTILANHFSPEDTKSGHYLMPYDLNPFRILTLYQFRDTHTHTKKGSNLTKQIRRETSPNTKTPVAVVSVYR